MTKNFPRHKLATSFLLLLVLISQNYGCATQEVVSLAEESLATEDLRIDIFSARGFLGGSDYERYYLTNNLLWRECGSVALANNDEQSKPLEGDKVLSKDPNLDIQTRRVENLTKTQKQSLMRKVEDLLTIMHDTSLSFPPPGSVFGMSAPGLFEMRIDLGQNSKHIVTTVDAIADDDTLLASSARDIYASLRGIGPVICNSTTFFGISRNQLN